MSEPSAPEDEFDWSQTRGSPALHRANGRLPPPEDAGRFLTVLLFAGLLLIELVGACAGRPADGSVPLLRAAGRFLLLCGLLVCVWWGAVWARLLLCALLLFAGALAFRPGVRNDPPPVYALGCVHLLFCAGFCLPPVARFLDRQRLL